MIEEFTAAHCVAEVNLPIVIGVCIAHRCSGAALGHYGVRFAKQGLTDNRDFESSFARFYSGA